MQRLAPVRLREERRHHIGEKHQRQPEEHPLHALVGAAHHEQPHAQGRHGYRDVLRHAEHLHARGDAGEFGEGRRHVADEKRKHGEGGDANAEALADEGGEALACDGAHAAGRGLHDGEQHAHDGDDPQGAEAEVRAGRGIGGDAAGVVAGHGGHDAGAHGRQHQQ